MEKYSVSDLKKHFKTCKQEELIKMLVDCYKQSADVKKYVHFMIDPERATKQLYEEAKEEIEQQFYPKRGEPKLKLSKAKKAISDFNKLCNDSKKTIDLMIYYVELGVQFTNDYGDIDEPFYYSIELMYQNALKKIQDEEESAFFDYQKRLKAIMDDTEHIGWGFHDQLAGMYLEAAAGYEYEDNDKED